MKATRKSITQPADWWAEFEAAATKDGMTLADWVGKTCKASLPRKVQKKLSERTGAGRPKSKLT